MFSLPCRVLLPALLAAGIADATAQPPARGAQTPSPVRPMYRQADSGWLAREVYRSPAGGGVAVQFLDVLVGPGRKAQLRSMPTGALLDVKAGIALVTVGQAAQRGVAGVVIPIDQGQSLSIENRESDRAFVARLIRIASPRRP
jgi:hypothetical protein